jgi:hypothetical protein
MSRQAHRQKIVTLRCSYTNMMNLGPATGMPVLEFYKPIVQLELADKI